jgi:hypothetical protein
MEGTQDDAARPGPGATIDEHPLGLSWVLEEVMARASHALVDDGRVWLVDPVDVPAAVERAVALGTPAGVVQLLDRHNRDCATLAARLGVPHLRVPDAVPGSPFEAIPAVRAPGWRETALWWPERSALIVAEVLGSAAYMTGGSGTVGMHLMLRPLAPGRLRRYEPEHLLMGHGPGVHGPAAATELERAHARARRDLPRVLAKLPLAYRPR